MGASTGNCGPISSNGKLHVWVLTYRRSGVSLFVHWVLFVPWQTLAARGLEEHVRITLIFFENHQFHVIYCVTLAYMYSGLHEKKDIL